MKHRIDRARVRASHWRTIPHTITPCTKNCFTSQLLKSLWLLRQERNGDNDNGVSSRKYLHLNSPFLPSFLSVSRPSSLKLHRKRRRRRRGRLVWHGHPVRRLLVVERRQRRRGRHRRCHRGCRRCRRRRDRRRVAPGHAGVAHGGRGGQGGIGGGEGGRSCHGGRGVGRLLRGRLLVRVRGREGVLHNVELLLGHDVLVLLERAPLLCPPILEPNLDLKYDCPGY